MDNEPNEPQEVPLIDKKQLLMLLAFIRGFFKNPLEAVKSIPDWDWPIIIIFTAGISVVSGVASGVLQGSFITLILSMVFVPLGSLLITAALAGFFYYTFFFFFNRELVYRQLYTTVIICSLPILITQPFTVFIKPLILIGVLATFFLMIVSFVEHFHLPRKPVSKLMGMIFLIYAVSWIFNMIEFSKQQEELRNKFTPESLDILERDLQNK